MGRVTYYCCRQSVIPFAFLFFFPGAIAIAQAPVPNVVDANSLLRKCLKSLDNASRIEMRVHVDVSYPLGLFRKGDLFQSEVDTTFRKDGNKIDVGGRILFEGGKKPDARDFRWVFAEDRMLGYELPAEAPRKRGVTAAKYTDHYFTWLGHPFYGGTLDGFLYACGNRHICQLMIDSGAASHHGRQSIGGILCDEISATTSHGKCVVWLEDGSGVLVAFRVTKGSGDLHAGPGGGSQPLSEDKVFGDGESVMEWSASLGEVQIVQESGKRLASGGTVVIETKSSSGRAVQQVYRIRRSEIKVDPDWSGQGAFHIDLAEGAHIDDLDKPDSGVRLVWHRGKVALADAAFRDQFPPGVFGGTRNRLVFLIVGNGLLILVLAIIYWFRAKSRSSPKSGSQKD